MTDRRMAIISDIHGNRMALEKVLADIDGRNITQIVDLGDSVYGPLDPAGTADIMMERNIHSVMGNEDRAIIEEPLDFNSHSSLEYTRNKLAPRHLKWLKSLPVSRVIDGDIYLCHGTPDKDTKYLIESVGSGGVTSKSVKELSRFFDTIPQKIIFCGHSHQSHTIYLEPGKWIINPGSVGLQAYTDDLPYPHAMTCENPLAKYCILELNASNQPESIQHIEVPYDWDSASRTAATNGNSAWSNWLKSGRATI